MAPNPSTDIHSIQRNGNSVDACRVTIFNAGAFDLDASPACTSIAMFRSPSPPAATRPLSDSKLSLSQQQSDDPSARCPICVAPFVPNGAAVPKTLPCGHSFCAECIFSLCLHKEYYLLESIFCLKCGAPCDARRAMNAPSAEAMSNDKEASRAKLMADDCENDNNVTVIHLTNTRAPSSAASKQNTVSQRPSAVPILGTSTLSRMTSAATPRRRVRARRAGDPAPRLPSPPPPPPPPPALSPWPADEPDYCNDSCGTSAAADYERIGRYYRSSSAVSGGYQTRGRVPSAWSTEMETELNSDYGSGSCVTSTVASHATDDLSRWRAKFVRRTRRMDAQLTRARQIVRAAQLASEIEAEIGIKGKGVDATVAVDGYGIASSRRSAGCETRAHFQRYANVLAAYDESKRILKREFVAVRVDNVRAVRQLTRRLDTLRQLLERCRFDFEARRVAPSSTASAIDGICACVDAIVALTDSDASATTVEALERLTRGMRAAAGADDGQQPQVGRALADTVRLLTALLNEQTSVETIPFFDLSFAFAFRALKRIVRATRRAHAAADVSARQAKLWKMAQSAYSELLRVAGTHWPCADARRVALVASTAQMCALFAEVCDTATVLLCIIEAARARVALANAATAAVLADDADESTDTPSAVETAERSRAQFHLQRIDDHLLECRRVQKMVELRTRTRLLSKQMAANDGTAPPTPAAVARHAAAAVAARLTPRKRAAVGDVSADASAARKPPNCAAGEAPAARRRPPFWRRILPRRMFRATTH